MTNYYQDHPGAYGATYPHGAVPMQGKGVGNPFARGPRHQTNVVVAMLSLFVPWILFSVLYSVMSFSWHYQYPQLVYCVCALGFVIVLLLAHSAAQASSKGNQDPNWQMFAFATTFLAWVLAVLCGESNFFNNMQPYYDVISLNTYPAVNPKKMKGGQFMDAGRVDFVKNTSIDLSKAAGFKNLDTYCVAPITLKSQNKKYEELDSYDFWAVGLNCCNVNPLENTNFNCGEYNNPQARSGLRLMHDEQRGFYRLAVQQAEATFGIRAVHPLFFFWLQDPLTEVQAYQDDGYKYYLLGVFSHFSLQLFLVIVAVSVFKIG